MSARARPFVLFLAASALALVAPPERARACCPAYGRDASVTIGDQEILIAWDKERHLEHFVRHATFEAKASNDFGFLVPTPSKPTLTEASNDVFDGLRGAMLPKHEPAWEIDWMPLLLYTFALRSKSAAVSASASAPAVRVLDEQTIAGYDAAVLEADDAGALTRWLAEHGYDARPQIEEWVAPYIAMRWKITAFKYARSPAAAPDAPGEAAVATHAVCMSFATDRPVFPYRVPTDQIAKPGEQHVLRVFFAGDERVDGSLGAAPAATLPWPGQVRYANRIDNLGQLLAGALPVDAAARATWLTVFDDATWPSGRQDLFFTRASDASPVVPIVRDPKKIPAPLDVLAVVVGGGFWMRRRRARRSARAAR